MSGVVAAGHPLSVRAGADALRSGGTAVDAALAAMLASCACEPLLTGLGAGGYMLVCPVEEPAVLLDFFVEAPGRGADLAARGELVPVSVSFGEAVQVFNIGPASVGTYGVPAGICAAARRFGRLPLAELAAPAVRLARDGVLVSRQQAYLLEILGGIVTSTPEASARFAPAGRMLAEGERLVQPELATALEQLASEGAEPFYRGEPAARIARWVGERGGLLTAEDLAQYRVIDRRPVSADYRGRRILTNPPPSAGGILIARALAELEALPAASGPVELVAVMEHTQALRTPEFLDGLDDPTFVERFLGSGRGPFGSTTHTSVIDAAGAACSVTCSNGACSGVIVPGTGIHLNNMLGEQDLNPLGFHRFPPGRRLPSMMAPTVVLRDGVPELVLGSAGSNRIRSAILQAILRGIDDEMRATEAVQAPRLHVEDGIVYAEPGIDVAELEAGGHTVARFRAPNLFFGGVQLAGRTAEGEFHGAGDPRRGGDALVV